MFDDCLVRSKLKTFSVVLPGIAQRKTGSVKILIPRRENVVVI